MRRLGVRHELEFIDERLGQGNPSFIAQCSSCRVLWVGRGDRREEPCNYESRGAFDDCGTLKPLPPSLSDPLVTAYRLGGWKAVKTMVKLDQHNVVIGLVDGAG